MNAVAAPTSVAGGPVSSCSSTADVNITSGATASNYTTITWTSNGTGILANPNSLTLCTYTPSAADIVAGSVVFTLTSTGTAPCADAISTKTLTIVAPAAAAAGSNMTSCISATSINVTAGASAASYSSVLWTSSGTGTFSNANSLTNCTYNPSAADRTSGSVVLTLTVIGIAPCGNATATKTLTFVPNPSANPGSAISSCASAGAVSITTGAFAAFYNSVLWTSSGSGTFTNANSISTCTYTPSAADKIAGSVTLTLTAFSPGCSNGAASKILTIVPAATAVAGPAASICQTGGSITAGSTASNYSAIT
ncbi:MAG TPA: hypothetical protein VGB67_04400, partial [Fibrella sp.]